VAREIAARSEVRSFMGWIVGLGKNGREILLSGAPALLLILFIFLFLILFLSRAEIGRNGGWD
jgi:hypothetical protein